MDVFPKDKTSLRACVRARRISGRASRVLRSAEAPLLTGPGSVKYIGKETNMLQEVQDIHAAGDAYAEYTAWKDIITRLAPKKAAEAGISKRNLSYLKKRLKNNEPIHLKEKTKRKLRGL